MYVLASFLKGLLIRDAVDTTKQLSVQISPSATTGTATTLIASQTANRTIALPDSDGTLGTDSSVETLTNKTIDGNDNTLLNIPTSSFTPVPGDANNFLVRDGSGNVVSNTKAVPTGVVVGTTDSQTLTNKSIDATTNTLSNISNSNIASAAAIAVNKLAALTPNRAVATDGSGFLTPSTTTDTELGFVSGVTSSIQTQLDSKTGITGSFTDNHVIRADGTANIQNSAVVIDDSANVTGVNAINSIAGNGLSIGSPTPNAIQSGSFNTSLFLTTANSAHTITTDRKFEALSPVSGTPGRVAIQQDRANGVNEVTIQTATLTANRTLTLPDATTTVVGTDAVQTLTNKTFGDAVTDAQIATPSNPASGFNKIYFKNDNILYSLNSAGVETAIGAPSLTNPMTTGGDMIYGGASGVPTRLANGTSGQLLKSTGGTSAPTWVTPVLPTVQRFTSGSGTYTTPANCKWIRVRLVGGGGGGAGSGSATGTAATSGGNTTFGTSLLTGNGGTFGVHGGTSGTGGAGGTVTVSSPAVEVFSCTGQRGGSNFLTSTTFGGGGMGGSSPFSGGGAMTANAAGGSAVANTGSGGGGGGGTSSAVQIGNGGGAGGYIEAIITSPSTSYSFAVGTSGSAGGAGTNGNVGGAGAAGQIIVEEYY